MEPTFYIDTSLCNCVTASNVQVARPECNPRQGITLPETSSFDLLDWTGDAFSPVLSYLLTSCLAGFLLKTENRWLTEMSTLSCWLFRKKLITGRERLIRSHSSARFCFELQVRNG